MMFLLFRFTVVANNFPAGFDKTQVRYTLFDSCFNSASGGALSFTSALVAASVANSVFSNCQSSGGHGGAICSTAGDIGLKSLRFQSCVALNEADFALYSDSCSGIECVVSTEARATGYFVWRMQVGSKCELKTANQTLTVSDIWGNTAVTNNADYSAIKYYTMDTCAATNKGELLGFWKLTTANLFLNVLNCRFASQYAMILCSTSSPLTFEHCYFWNNTGTNRYFWYDNSNCPVLSGCVIDDIGLLNSAVLSGVLTSGTSNALDFGGCLFERTDSFTDNQRPWGLPIVTADLILLLVG